MNGFDQNKILITAVWLFLMSIIFPPFSFAQKVSISNEITLRDESAYSLLGKIDDRILLLRNKSMLQELSIFDEELGFIQTVPIDIEDRKEYIIGVNVSNHDFTLIYSLRDRNEKLLKAVKLNKRGEVLVQDTVEIIKSELMEGYYSFATSENERYAALFQDTKESAFKFLVYDTQEMNLVSVGEVAIENIDARRDFRNLTVSDNGELYALFERYGFKFKLGSHYLHGIQVNKSGSISHHKIPMPDKYLTDSKIVVNPSTQQSEIVGLYGNEYDNVSKGYFICDWNEINFISFMSDNNDMIINQEVHLENGLENYRLMDVAYRVDGGLLLIIEKNMEYFRTTTYARDFMVGNRSGTVDFITEDIFLVNTEPTGKIAWKLVLPKRQISQDDDGIYSSYFLFKNNSKLRFIFNDEIKTDNTVSEYIVNPIGSYERNALINTANQKLKLRIKSALQISASSFILISERGNKLNIVKVDY